FAAGRKCHNSGFRRRNGPEPGAVFAQPIKEEGGVEAACSVLWAKGSFETIHWHVVTGWLLRTLLKGLRAAQVGDLERVERAALVEQKVDVSVVERNGV